MPLRALSHERTTEQFGTTGGNPHEIRPSSTLRPCIHHLRSHVCAAQTPTVAAVADSPPFAKNFSLVDKDSNIAKPDDYRDKYETLGTYFVLDPTGNQMHMTYASPGTAAYFRQNGKFADGTVLVKEIFIGNRAGPNDNW